jgi:hypothetical protein
MLGGSTYYTQHISVCWDFLCSEESQYNNSMKESNQNSNNVRATSAFNNSTQVLPDKFTHWSFTKPKKGYKKAPIGSLQSSPERWALIERGC